MLPESEIGDKIRRLRKNKEMTLDQLAVKCSVTKGYLSKVENSDKAPPVSTLINIAAGLGVGISEIFGEDQVDPSLTLVKKKDRLIMARDGTRFGYSYETLAHSYPRKHMEPYILTIPKDIEQHPLFQHKGEEMLMVLKGNLRFLHGNQDYKMAEGDSIYFDSGIPHRGFVVGDVPVKCLIVIYNPNPAKLN